MNSKHIEVSATSEQGRLAVEISKLQETEGDYTGRSERSTDHAKKTYWEHRAADVKKRITKLQGKLQNSIGTMPHDCGPECVHTH